MRGETLIDRRTGRRVASAEVLDESFTHNKYRLVQKKVVVDSSRAASLNIAETSHIYAFLSKQPVASNFPSAENGTHFTDSACSRDKLIGSLFSRFHNRAVFSEDALASMRPFGDVAMP